MNVLQRKAMERQRNSYLDKNRITQFEPLPVFEMKEDGVHVDIINEGLHFMGYERHVISYEQFNEYLKEGLVDKGDFISWDHLANNKDKNYVINLPAKTIEWELKNAYLTTREKLGGRGFPFIETMQDGPHVNRGVEADFGSIYEVEVRHLTGVDNNTALKHAIKVESVNKFTGKIYQLKKPTDFRKIQYLTDYLSYAVENSKDTYGKYISKGMEDLFRDMVEYEHTANFREEIFRIRNQKKEIDWDRVEK